METCFCPGLDQLREVVIFFREEVILEVTKKNSQRQSRIGHLFGHKFVAFYHQVRCSMHAFIKLLEAFLSGSSTWKEHRTVVSLSQWAPCEADSVFPSSGDN